MTPFRPTLLLTRPEPASAQFAADFRARFGAEWSVVCSPLMALRLLPAPPPPDDLDDVIVTSQAAVVALAGLTARRDLRVWCVGPATAATAGAAGFDAVAGPGDAAGLAALVAVGRPGGRVYYPRGTKVARDMAALLRPAGIETIEAVVYDQPAIAPAATARQLLAGADPVLLPLFSPRAAQLFHDAFAAPRAPLRIAAISATVARAAEPLMPERLAVAARPDAAAMLDALAELFAATDPA
ncbi:MAG: uroporphyrinogen-III synthase [Alphaproteobacteria bacterium HGW-Alphaproteobacteria-6]|nr:MAG: uroporphyrinogen-III synthase [Alphaproteobacteria bacterium HGW-Alphaproteobacteria-6]